MKIQIKMTLHVDDEGEPVTEEVKEHLGEYISDIHDHISAVLESKGSDLITTSYTVGYE